MGSRTVLEVNVRCLQVSRTIREEVTRNSSQNVVHFRYVHNVLNYSQSNSAVSEQSTISSQGSEYFSSHSQEQVSPVESETHDECDNKTIILSSDDDASDKNDTGECLFVENNNKYYHDCNADDGASSDASTIAGSVHGIKLDMDDCSSPEDIQMPEITSTEPVNIVKFSPSLDVEDHLNYATEESSTGERRSSGKPTIIADEVYPQKVLVYIQPVMEDDEEGNRGFLGFNPQETGESNSPTFWYPDENVNEDNQKFLGFNPHKTSECNAPAPRYPDENADEANSKFLGFNSNEIDESNIRTYKFTYKVEKEAGDSTLQKECLSATFENNKDSLSISISSMKSEDLFGSIANFPPIFPAKFSGRRMDFTEPKNLLNFQDLDNTVETNQIAYNFPSRIRDTPVGERSESPLNLYLRSLPNQVEPCETVVRGKNINRSSILCPPSEPKGYSQLTPLFMELKIKDSAELKKLQARRRNNHRKLVLKEKLKLKKNSSASSPAESIAKESVWNTPNTRSTTKESIKPKILIRETHPRKQRNEFLEGPRNGRITRSSTHRRTRLSMKEVRIILTPLEYSSSNKIFRNKRQTSDSNFDSSLVPEMNSSSHEFEEYEHLKLSRPISIEDSTDDSHFTEAKSLEEARTPGSDIDLSEETLKVRKAVEIQKSPENHSPCTIPRSRTILKHHLQLRNVSKKVTFSPDITLYYIEK